MNKTNRPRLAKKLVLSSETLRLITGASTSKIIKPSGGSCNDPLCTLGSVASDCCNPITNAC